MTRSCLSIALALALLLAACSLEDPGAPDAACEATAGARPDRPRNVVLVVADTLRRDRVGAYGGPARTPSFDAIAAAGWRFDHAVSTAPWTKPAMASLFTGLPAAVHGMTTHPRGQQFAGEKVAEVVRSDVLPQELTTLAEAYAAAGYRTGAFVSNPWLDARFGLAQGFETYRDQSARWGAPGAVLSRLAAGWVEELPEDAPWFLYVHYLDVHRPHHAIPAARVEEERASLEADRRHLAEDGRQKIGKIVRVRGGEEPPPSRALLELAYDQGVEAFDRALGVLVERLARRPDWNETLFVVTSDHGEALFARGYGNHGRGLFDDELAIPLAIRGPGVPAAVVACPVSLLDVMPTLCGWSGLDCPDGLEGRDLLDPASTGRLAGYLVSEGLSERPRNRAIRDGRFKLVHEPEGSWVPIDEADPFRLFDLERDPQEENDLLAGPFPGRAAAVRARLAAALEELPVASPGGSEGEAVVDEALLEQLRQLGYVDDEDNEAGVRVPGDGSDASLDDR